MSIGTTVVAALSQIGTVEDVERIRESNCGYFVPDRYPMADGPTDARCSLNFIKRIGADPAIRIVVRSDIQSTKVDLARVSHEVTSSNSQTIYGSVNIQSRNLGEDREFTVVVTHSISVRGLTEELLLEVIHDMLHLWQDSMIEVRRSIARIERREELDERMKARIEQEEKRAKFIERQMALRKRRASALQQIDQLVGLGSVKKFAHGLVAQQHLVDLRNAHGLANEKVAPHLVFLGDPGTGKTTVARLVGRLYKELGLLPNGHVVEVERASLVGGYIGHTALKTRQMCEKALGGVLFIDEAYSLAVDGRDYGDEALATILTFMENNRGKLAVIVAGYPKQMDAMLDSNPGLRSRFDATITFDNYSPQDLLQMFVNSMHEQEYELTESALLDVEFMFSRAAASGLEMNARSVRGLVSEVLGCHADVMMGLGDPSLQQIKTITSLSIPPGWADGRPLTSSEIEDLTA